MRQAKAALYIRLASPDLAGLCERAVSAAGAGRSAIPARSAGHAVVLTPNDRRSETASLFGRSKRLFTSSCRKGRGYHIKDLRTFPAAVPCIPDAR
jgi:hypothetical protein